MIRQIILKTLAVVDRLAKCEVVSYPADCGWIVGPPEADAPLTAKRLLPILPDHQAYLVLQVDAANRVRAPSGGFRASPEPL